MPVIPLRRRCSSRRRSTHSTSPSSKAAPRPSANGRSSTSSFSHRTHQRCWSSTPPRSQIFMAARFDATRAKALKQRSGDGTPIMLTIPTDQPWVPLRILSLGLPKSQTVDADVFLLTDDKPIMLAGGEGLELRRSEPANAVVARGSPFGQGNGVGAAVDVVHLPTGRDAARATSTMTSPCRPT